MSRILSFIRALAEYEQMVDQVVATEELLERQLFDRHGAEVHYEGTPEQNASIKRILCEKHKPVYATHFMNGAIMVDNGTVKSIGRVSIFDCQHRKNR